MNDLDTNIQEVPSTARLHLKIRILVPLLAVIIILVITVTSRIYQIEYQHIRDEVLHIQDSARELYQFSLEKRGQELSSVLEAIMRDRQLMEAFRSKKRQAILNQGRPLFERLKEKSGITHFYFHTTDRMVIMRLHLPNQFGDYINRRTLLDAEATGKISTGAELGPFGTFTLRSVAPWYDDDGVLLGYIELGVSLEEMTVIFERIYSVEPYLVINKDLIIKERWEAIMQRFNKEVDWNQLANAVIIAGPPRAMPPGLAEIFSEQPLDEDYGNIQIKRDDNTYITGEIVLTDANQQRVGKLVMLFDITSSVGELNHAIRNLAGYSVFLNGVLFIIFFIILNKAERLFTLYYIKMVNEGKEREKLQEEHIKELEHLALYDPLTDLPNRQLLQDRIKHAIQIAQRENYPLALAILNLSRLREINNTLGHQSGDVVLQQVAARLQQSVRASDTVARLGGDEFAVLMPKVDITLSQLAVDKLQSLLEATFDVEGIPISVSASFGIAFYPHDSNNVYNLIRHADVAMRDARNSHRGVVIYDAERDPYNLRKLKLFSDLKNAFSNRELFLVFQPKINVTNHQVNAVEALVRWQHPTEGLIPPDEFIPLLENTALIKILTQHVLDAALRQCAEWRKQNMNIRVSINVSMFDLFTTDIAEQINDALQHYGLDPTCLVLEITETVIMEEPQATIQLLRKLHGMEIKLSIDDFGTGYSSLSYLQQLPVSELKIDRSFISKMSENSGDEVIVRSTIQLAHNLGLTVVAEGVDDRDTWDILETMECDVIQGHFISPPMHPDEFRNWLQDASWRQKLK